jgi:hypothetical protein
VNGAVDPPEPRRCFLNWIIAIVGESAADGQDGGLGQLAVIRHIAVNLPRSDDTRPIGLTYARFKAALSDTYLRSIPLGVCPGATTPLPHPRSTWGCPHATSSVTLHRIASPWRPEPALAMGPKQ